MKKVTKRKKLGLMQAIKEGKRARQRGIENYYVPWKKIRDERSEKILEQCYARGYQRKPEQANDFKPLFLAGLKSFGLWEKVRG